MKLLKIDLQDGFNEDSVIIDINGHEIFRGQKVSTKLLLGFADIIETQVPEGNSEIRISLPDRSMESRISLHIEKDTYLGISLTKKGVESHFSETPFPYL